ncbi:DUF732 domain-containing protein [Streptomyces nojiriensis]|uniref:DUF732 domain-containing protein n=1 Tax=Streptomyces nojiriensis TaxID=66374 RepID=UPI00364B64EE
MQHGGQGVGRAVQQQDDKADPGESEYRLHPVRHAVPAERRGAAQVVPAGIPPSPAPEQRAIYLAALNKIDPKIVNGKDDEAVSRGLSQCQSMKDEKDPTKHVESTNRRFISPNHPDGFGPTKAAFILAAVQTNLCPTY